MDNVIRFILSKAEGKGRVAQNWFLPRTKWDRDAHFESCESTIEILINGENAFGKLFEEIEKAEKSIDIAIWGFQPSMFFKRDGNSPCIGELLMKKAMDGVQVRLLVWSMTCAVQLFFENNLGGFPFFRFPPWHGTNVLKLKNLLPHMTDDQSNYDYWWYNAVMGDLYPHDLEAFPKRNTGSKSLYISAFERIASFCNKNQNQMKNNQKYENLELRFRSIEMSFERFFDTFNKPMFFVAPTHHQKTVSIDYHNFEKARGFVLEHNMLDAYWDTSEHKSDLYAPNLGKNYFGNYQDVSSFVTGKILYDIQWNFEQSWARAGNLFEELSSEYALVFNLRYDKAEKDKYKPSSDTKSKLMLQALRTYDEPSVEDIKKMYLQNITKVTSYIYTENQYFRWKELADKLIEHINNLKECGRDVATMPIHWFVVTNSSDEGVESGSKSMNEMLKVLGQQDVLPVMTKEFSDTKDYSNKLDNYNKKWEELKIKEKEYIYNQATKEQKVPFKDLDEYNQKIEDIEKLNQELMKEEKQFAEEAAKMHESLPPVEGVKIHICTLANADSWHEVYVHSKVTVIDDVFFFIGSANINERSMKVDTEFGIIGEKSEVSSQLRRDLWALHTKNDRIANPIILNNPNQARESFRKWTFLLEKNWELKMNKKPPKHPLCKFLRLSAKKHNWD